MLESSRRSLVIALIVGGAFFMEQLDATVIATALPQMARSFHDDPVNLSLGITAYLLTLAVFIPISAWTADRFGSRTVFAGAIVVFTLASVLCGLSNSLAAFIAARVVQGIGGAMMVPVGRLVVLRSTDKPNLIQSMNLISTPGLVAPVLGPPLGGFITTYFTWRWIFFLNVPLGLLALALVLVYMKNQRDVVRRPFDALGFVLTGAGLASLMYGFDLTGRPGAQATAIVPFIASGAGLVVLAVLHARRHPTPVLDLAALRLPTFATSTLWGGSLFRMAIGTTIFLWPLMFQVGFGMNAFASGLLVLSCAAGDLSMKSVTTQLIRRFGFRNLLIANGLIVSASIAVCVAFTAETPKVLIVVVLWVIGMSRSMQFTSLSTLAFADVPPPLMSTASSFSSMLQQLSFGMGVALGAVLLHAVVLARGGPGAVLGTVDFRLAFAAVAVVAGLSVISIVRLRPGVGSAISGHGAPAATG
jgi:EmrB/QacA subfamily drug resistance transporter